MVMFCKINAIPRKVQSGGSVRFFPVVIGNTKPIVSYAWDFGDTGTSTDATPIHQYPVVTTITKYTVTVTVTDSDGGSSYITEDDFITVDDPDNIPGVPKDGSYHKVSAYVYDDTNAMLVNRNATAICHLFLQNPVVVNSIDKSPTCTFSLLDIGNSNATEKSLISEGKYVIIIQSNFIVFSGIIRRATSRTTGAYTAVGKIVFWDIECDSDLMRLSKTNVDPSVLAAGGEKINDTPGYLARRILMPPGGEYSTPDWRGNICCNDTKIQYQLNSLTEAEQTQSQYDHIITLRTNTNYDMITRPEFDVGSGVFFDGVDTFTASAVIPRMSQASATLPSGLHVVAGGTNDDGLLNDVWVSSLDCSSWSRINPNASWGVRAGFGMVSLSTGVLIVAGGYNDTTMKNDVWSSDDMGVTWNLVTDEADWSARQNFTLVALQDDSIVLIGGYDITDTYKNDVWRSTDGGENWTRLTASAGFAARQFHTCVVMQDNSLVVAGGMISDETKKSDVWRSTNNGASWTEQTSSAEWDPRSEHTCIVAADGSLVLAAGMGDEDWFGDVWRSTNSGANWTLKTDTPGWNERKSISSFLLTNDDIVIALGIGNDTGYNDEIWGTSDNGGTWSLVTFSPWEIDAFIGRTLFYTNENGCRTYGTITDNTETTVTADLVTSETEGVGSIIIYNGSKIDFAPDLATPSALASYGVNKDVFNFSDNDDKRKFFSKVVVKGKDLQGVTASVSLTACHAYDNDKQYYKDSTHITLKSEGYVYKNNYVTNQKTVTTVYPEALYKSFTTNYASYPTRLIISPSDSANFPVNSKVYFETVGGTLPSNITGSSGSSIVRYFIRANGAGYLEISTTQGGAAMDIGSDSVGTCYVEHNGGLMFNNSEGYVTSDAMEIYFSASTLPGGVSSGTPYYISPAGYLSSAFWGFLYSDSIKTESTRISISSAGSNVKIIRTPDIQNHADLGVTPKIWLYGWGYSIPSGSTVALSIPYGASVAAVTSGATSESTDANGTQYTELGFPLFPASDFSGKGYLLNRRLYVADSSLVGNNEVLIGEEQITIDSNGNDTTYGNYIQFSDVTARVTSASLKCYPHGIGALVARTNYTESSPETGSPLDEYGLSINSQTVDTTITYGDLDSYATTLLLGFGSFYKKAVCMLPLLKVGVKRVELSTCPPVGITTPPMVGDTLEITMFDGESSENFEVVSVTIRYDEGLVALELGDYEKNVFTSLKQETNAINRTFS